MEIKKMLVLLSVIFFGLVFILNSGDSSDSSIKFKYSEQLSLDQIPDSPVEGILYGNRFVIKTISLEFDNRGKMYRLVFSAGELKTPREIMYDRNHEYLVLMLAGDITEGKIFEKTFSYGGGHWQKNSESSNKKTSWNAKNTYILKITKWDMKPYDKESKEIYQVRGYASGKIAVCFKGFEEKNNSWIAGTFENAPIISKRP